MKQLIAMLTILVLATSILFAQVAIIWEEDFDTSTNLPDGWINDSWFDATVESGIGVDGSNAILFHAFYYTTTGEYDDMELYTPPIEDLRPISAISFDYRFMEAGSTTVAGSTSGLGTFEVYVCSGNFTDYAYIWDLQDHVTSTEYRTITIPLEDFDGEAWRIIFHSYYVSDIDIDIHIDNVKVIAPNPEDYDLKALSITGRNAPSVNTTNQYTVTIRNMGLQPVLGSAYTVSLFGDNSSIAIGTQDGVDIEPGVRTIFTFGWTPIDVATTCLYSVVTYEADENLDNNQSPNYPVVIQPEGKLYIGDPYSEDYFQDAPFPLDVGTGLNQTLYYADELIEGEITQIGYRFHNADTDLGLQGSPAEPKDIRVWMKQTDKEGFVSRTDAEPFEGFTLVYNGTIAVNTPGENDIYITLDTPFVYDTQHPAGQNLVVMVERVFENEYYSPDNNWQFTQTPYQGRMLIYRSRFYPLTNDPSEGYPDFMGPVQWIPNTFMYVSDGPFATVTGNVKNATNEPLAGAYVGVTDTEHKVLTDADGIYTLRMVSVGNISITVTMHGYLDNTNNTVMTEANQTISSVNFTMSLHPTVAISGTILSSDTGAGLGGATVKLSGYENYEAITSPNGYFILPTVFDNLAYTITVSRRNYEGYTGRVDVGDTASTVPPITLEETLKAAINVKAMVNPNNSNETIVSWFNPLWGQSVFSHTPANGSMQIMGPNDENSTFTIAHRYTAEHLANFQATGYDLYKVGFVAGIDYYIDLHSTYTVKVWVTTNNALPYPDGLEPVCSLPVPNIIDAELIEVILPTSIRIPENGQIFVGLEIYAPFGNGINYPITMYQESFIEGYSDLLQWEGEWMSSGIGLGIPASWLIYLTAIEPDINDTAPVVFSTISELKSVKPSKSKFDSSSVLVKEAPNFSSDNLLLGHKPNRVTRAFNGDMEIFRMLSTDTAGDTPLAVPHLDFTRRDMQYIDTSWNYLEPQIYKYALRTIYTGSEYTGGFLVSDHVYSNNLVKSVEASLTVNVTMQGQPVTGAKISLTHSDTIVPDLSYIFTAHDAGTHTFPVIYLYIPYDVTVAIADGFTYNNVHLFAENENTLYINLLDFGILIDEPFNGPQPYGWTNVDADNDGLAWEFELPFISSPDGYSTVALSKSYDFIYTGDPIFPDNWLISDRILLPEGEVSMLKFLVSPMSPNRTDERLLLYIAPASDDEVGWETFLVNRNDTMGNAGSPDGEILVAGATLLDDHTTQRVENDTNGYYELSYDISQYGGQEIHIAFRHAFCENEFALLLANLVVGWSDITPISISGTVIDDDGAALTGATISTYSTILINATTNEIGAFTLQNVPGDATYTVTIKKTGFADKNIQVPVGVSNHDMGTIVMTPGYSDESDLSSTSKVTALKANYPNPFNPSTTISFDLARDGAVSIDIYNIKGQKVKEVASGRYSAGSHRVVWNGDDATGRAVGSGIYFYRMTTEGYTSVKKMLLMK